MLRLLVVLLIAANAGYFAWAHGALQRFGMAPVPEGEPQRMAQQLHPEALRLVADDGPAPSAAAGAAGATGTEPTAAAPGSTAPAPADAATAQAATAPAGCLQSSLLDMAQAAAVRERAGAVLPAGRWSLEPATQPARWIIYMGRYTDAEQVERKRDELRGLGLSAEPLINAALEPGLSLGAFTSRESASAALAALARRGVRTGRVLEERPEQQGQVLRLAAAPEDADALTTQLSAALGSARLTACPAAR